MQSTVFAPDVGERSTSDISRVGRSPLLDPYPIGRILSHKVTQLLSSHLLLGLSGLSGAPVQQYASQISARVETLCSLWRQLKVCSPR